jgi:hypothetical protein
VWGGVSQEAGNSKPAQENSLQDPISKKKNKNKNKKKPIIKKIWWR